MLKVGLTGGIACGKSVVRRRFAECGAFTLDADAVVHELFRPGTEIARTIEKTFGSEFLSSDGSVDRRKLGALVFADARLRETLNGIVHPVVIAEIGRRLAGAEQRGERVGIVDAALMIETGSYRRYDRLVVVFCPAEIQIRRLVDRGLSEEEASQRVEAQLSTEVKKRYADFVVDTTGSLAETERQVDAIWKLLLEE